MSHPPAGWYPQPDGSQRYWDGSQWTNHFAPGDPPVRPWYRKKRFLIPGIALVGIIIIGAIGSGSDMPAPEASPPPKLTETAEPDPTPSEEPVTPEPEESTPAPEPEPAATDTHSVAQTQAIRSAESYLSFMAFSRKGLIEQLEFEGFTPAEAEHGVGSISVDWGEQAELKAQEYLDLMGFSRSGLIDQLIFEGFTAAQAARGADAVGL